MKTDVTEIQINGMTYVPKGSAEASPAEQDSEGREYVIVRSNGAGVFAGYTDIDEDFDADTKTITIYGFRRLWYWAGAASLSQLANDGTKKPGECKFPAVVAKNIITNVLEVLSCTEKARKSIEGVKVWAE